MDPVERLEAENFANWLLQVGDGTATVPEELNKVKIPQGTDVLLCVTDFRPTELLLPPPDDDSQLDGLIDKIYPGIGDLHLKTEGEII
jgi:ATP-dependent DNA helicase PIF1